MLLTSLLYPDNQAHTFEQNPSSDVNIPLVANDKVRAL
jgi:hypothetical protein